MPTCLPSMEASYNALRTSLLMLTFGGAILACGTANHNSDPLRHERPCAIDPVAFIDAEPMCLLQKPHLSLHLNASVAGDQMSPELQIQDAEGISATTSLPSSPLYTVVPIPGRGLGLIATSPIPRGTKILIEPPLLTVHMPSLVPGQGFPLASMLASITTSYSSLPSSAQETFLSLHDHRFPGDEEVQQSHLLTIFRSNAYNTGESEVGLFPLIARINHDCRPNAVNYWSERLGKRVMYAGRDITVGEEITVSYVPLLKGMKERRLRLAQYGFVCGCQACSEESDGSEEGRKSGKRRGKIGDLMEVLETKVEMISEKVEVNERLVKRAEKLVKMLEEEELVDYWAKAYRFVALFEKRAENLKNARAWGEKVVAELKTAEDESEEIAVALEFLDELKL